MATTLLYNTVTLHNVQTREFRQEVVWDDSGTDPMYHRFTVSVVGHVHDEGTVAPTYALASQQDLGSATLNEIAIRQRLLIPRQRLQMTVDGVLLLHAIPAPATIALAPDMDVNNGPRPLHVDVQQIVGAKIFRVEFRVEVALVICEQLRNSNGVLSNRWSIGEEIDGNHFAVRTIQGRLRVASVSINPNSYRHFVIPRLPRGYRRETIALMVTPDGLNLDYSVVDRQIWHAPPEPCTDWEMMYAVSTEDGYSIIEEVSVKLLCSPNTNKRILVSLAVYLINSRLDVLYKLDHRDFQILHFAIADFIHANSVEARMRIKRLPRTGLWSVLGGQLGMRLRGKRGFEQNETYITRPPNYYGTGSAVKGLVCFLQSPCNDHHSVFDTVRRQESSQQQSSDKEGRNPDVYIHEVPSLPNESSRYSPEHSESMYTHYEVQSEYITNHLKLQLPVAGSGGSSEQASSVFVRLTGGGIAKRIITVSAERVGDWPSIPAPVGYQDVTGPAHLLHHEIRPSVPRRSADGLKQIKRIEAEYVYGLTRPPTSDESLRVGSLPWDVTTLRQNEVPASTLVAPENSRAIA